MADTLKFGPEWLRALSDGPSAPTPPASPGFSPGFTPGKYKLAEHRYGREEMLALYVPSSKIPEGLREFPSIINEKPLQPLAFIPPSEEEQRLMSQSVNSTAVLRMMGRGSGPTLRGGRGGGDRGRGRGRGRGEGGFSGFQRQTSFEEDGYGRGRHGRGEGWEEGEKGRFERGASGFGATRPSGSVGFEEGPTSPRREFSRSMSTDNWRDLRNKSGEEEDENGDWRRAGPRDKWSSRGSWRDHRDRDRDYDRGRYEDYGGEAGRFERTYHRSRSTGSWGEDQESDLPEWSTAEADDMDNLGTFDSSGAFMSLKEAKEMEEKGQEIEWVRRKPDKQKEDGKRDTNLEEDVDKDNESKPAEQEQNGDSSLPLETAEKGEDHEPAAEKLQLRGELIDTSNDVEPVRIHSPSVTPVTSAVSQPPSEKTEQASQGNQAEQHPPVTETDTNSKAPPSGEDLVNSIINEEVATQDGSTVMEDARRNLEDEFDHLEKAAEDLVATWTAEEDAKSDCKAKVESGGVPLDHEDAKKWFYRDPQGDLQGPFKAAEMAEWFSAGYFTMNLLVKRGCDETFQPLGELIKRWGRVPFLPGPSPPPLKSMSGGNVSSAAPTIPTQNTVDVQQEHLKLMQQQQQQLLIQQQLFIRQMQMNQMVATLQQQEGFNKLSPQQQQQLALQFLLKQQQPILQPQQQQPPPQQPTRQQSPPQPQPPQNLSPRSEQVAFQRTLSQQQAASGQPADAGVAGFHRSVSQQPMEDASIWGTANPPPTSAGWTSTTSVWDIDPPKAQSLEEIQRLERMKMEQQQREEVERRETERRRQEEELRKRHEEEERRRQEEDMMRRQEDERRKQVEMELERQRMEQLERIRLQREVEENARREEERRRREEEDRRRREEEERRQREVEERRRQHEEQRRKEQEELERKRQEEIRRRQEKAEEMRRQQQEALRRMQHDQMANIQLPSTAQWGNTSSSSHGNGTPSLAEIQEMEAARAAKETEDKQRRLEQQRQQLAAIQQQQQQQSKSWAQHSVASQAVHSRMLTGGGGGGGSGAPSLLEIQQEQSHQLELEKQRQQQQQKQAPQPNLSLSSAAVWSGASQASHWAAEGAWGNLQNRTTAGFWDDAIGGASNKKTTTVNSNSNANFPALSTAVSSQQAAVATKNKAAKVKREEETVQRLFQQAMKPKDEFTQWCENALKGMQAFVDVPTFIAFLQDVESPYEVHDYVRSYLGETKDASEFAKQFLERRSKFKNHQKQHQQQPEEIWGPAPAVNPTLKHEESRAANNTSKNSTSSTPCGKKKKRMQRVDNSFLGFTVHADPERVNIGEIENLETM